MKAVWIQGSSIAQSWQAYDKMLAWFFAFPTDEFSLNDLCSSLSLSKTTTGLVATRLIKEGFIQRKITGKLWRLTANQEHAYFTTRRIPFNLQLVYESGILEWISGNLPNFKAIVLFGSYRKGDDMPESDVDFAVEIPGNMDLEIVHVTLGHLGYRKNVAASIHLFSRSKVDRNLFSNIMNGIVLKGFLEEKQ